MRRPHEHQGRLAQQTQQCQCDELVPSAWAGLPCSRPGSSGPPRAPPTAGLSANATLSKGLWPSTLTASESTTCDTRHAAKIGGYFQPPSDQVHRQAQRGEDSGALRLLRDAPGPRGKTACSPVCRAERTAPSHWTLPRRSHVASLTLRRARTRRAAGSRSKRGGRTGLARVPQAQTPGPPHAGPALSHVGRSPPASAQREALRPPTVTVPSLLTPRSAP